MTTSDLNDLYERVGRVVVPAAEFELALATIAYAVLGGDDDANAKTHALPPAQLKSMIQPVAEAHPEKWWSRPVLDLLSRSDGLLAARHGVVHGHWTDLRGVVEGRAFVTFKPDRKSKQWQGQFLDIAQLAALVEQLEVLRAEARDLADRMVDDIHRHLGAPFALDR